MRKVLKGKRFAEVVEVKQKMAEALKVIKINEFKNGFEEWKKNFDKCIESSGEYFEGEFFKRLFIYLFLDRGEGRERERERERDQCVVTSCMPPTGTLGCALTGNWTSDPLVHRLVLNTLSHTSQGRRWLKFKHVKISAQFFNK